MTDMQRKIFSALTARRWLYARRGATAIEYGLIMAAVAVAIMAAILLFGENLGAIFEDSANRVAARP